MTTLHLVSSLCAVALAVIAIGIASSPGVVRELIIAGSSGKAPRRWLAGRAPFGQAVFLAATATSAGVGAIGILVATAAGVTRWCVVGIAALAMVAAIQRSRRWSLLAPPALSNVRQMVHATLDSALDSTIAGGRGVSTIRHVELAWWAATVSATDWWDGSSDAGAHVLSVPGRRGALRAVIPPSGPLTLVLVSPGGPIEGLTARRLATTSSGAARTHRVVAGRAMRWIAWRH